MRGVEAWPWFRLMVTVLVVCGLAGCGGSSAPDQPAAAATEPGRASAYWVLTEAAPAQGASTPGVASEGGATCSSGEVSSITQAVAADTFAIAAAPSLLPAARVEPDELARLLAMAARNQVTEVYVFTPAASGLLSRPLEQTLRDDQPHYAALLNDLGDERLDIGDEASATVFHHLIVTARGLQRLADSPHVGSFGGTWFVERSSSAHGDRSLAALDEAIGVAGQADVDVTLHSDAAEYDFGPDLAWRVHATAALAEELRTAWPRFFASLDARFVIDLERVRAAAGTSSPTVRMRITRAGYYLLRQHPLVRDIRLAGYADPRPASFDASLLRAGPADEAVPVSISLRTDAYMPIRGSRVALGHHADANERLFMALLGPAAAPALAAASAYRNIGSSSLSVTLSRAALRALYEGADPRLLHVVAREGLGLDATGLMYTTVTLSSCTAVPPSHISTPVLSPAAAASAPQTSSPGG